MAMKKTLCAIKEVIASELTESNKNYPLFHSRHEGKAVLQEEIEEMIDEYEKVSTAYKHLWNLIKVDGAEKTVIETLEYAKEHAELMVAEAVQVAAMLEKMIMFEEAHNER